MRVQATLIQCITEFRACLQPVLQHLVEKYAYQGAVLEDALQYVIAEELELIYALCDEHHTQCRRCSPYAAIYCELRNHFGGQLSSIVGHYIAAPRLYEEHQEVLVQLKGQDLFIHYFRDAFKPIAEVYYNAQAPKSLTVLNPIAVNYTTIVQP